MSDEIKNEPVSDADATELSTEDLSKANGGKGLFDFSQALSDIQATIGGVIATGGPNTGSKVGGSVGGNVGVNIKPA
jgi:hypothetical protein